MDVEGRIPLAGCCWLSSWLPGDPNGQALLGHQNNQRGALGRAKVRALGADKVILSSNEDLVSWVKKITHGKLMYRAIDPIGGKFTKAIGSCVRSGGNAIL